MLVVLLIHQSLEPSFEFCPFVVVEAVAKIAIKLLMQIGILKLIISFVIFRDVPVGMFYEGLIEYLILHTIIKKEGCLTDSKGIAVWKLGLLILQASESAQCDVPTERFEAVEAEEGC